MILTSIIGRQEVILLENLQFLQIYSHYFLLN